MTNQVKYLGVISDKKLDWRAYLEDRMRMRKACIAYWQCRPAWLYTSVVRPILSYALLVWWKRVDLKNTKKRLSHLQRMTCLGITGGIRSIPTSALEVMLMWPPLHLFIKQEARQAANRLLGNVCSFMPIFGQ
jgi:hypothetical protein